MKSTHMLPSGRSERGYKTMRNDIRARKKNQGNFKSRFSIQSTALDLAAKNPAAFNSLTMRRAIKGFTLLNLLVAALFAVLLTREYVVEGGLTWQRLEFGNYNISAMSYPPYPPDAFNEVLGVRGELGLNSYVVRLTGFSSLSVCEAWGDVAETDTYWSDAYLECDFPNMTWSRRYNVEQNAFSQLPWERIFLLVTIIVHLVFALGTALLMIRAKAHRLAFKSISCLLGLIMIVDLVFLWYPFWEESEISTYLGISNFTDNLIERNFTITLPVPKDASDPPDVVLLLQADFNQTYTIGGIFLTIGTILAWLAVSCATTAKMAHRSIYKAELRAELEDFYSDSGSDGYVPTDSERDSYSSDDEQPTQRGRREPSYEQSPSISDQGSMYSHHRPQRSPSGPCAFPPLFVLSSAWFFRLCLQRRPNACSYRVKLLHFRPHQVGQEGQSLVLQQR